VSVVLLWQPSDCIDLSVIDRFFVLFSENKYDDDEENHRSMPWLKPSDNKVYALL